MIRRPPRSTLFPTRRSSDLPKKEVRKQNGLRGLQVSSSRHRHAETFLGLFEQRRDQSRDASAHLARGILDKKAELGGHQLIAAAPGVQFVAEPAQLLHQSKFDEVVDVLCLRGLQPGRVRRGPLGNLIERRERSEEHTSELQSLAYLVCRLLLEKKKKKHQIVNDRDHSGVTTR